MIKIGLYGRCDNCRHRLIIHLLKDFSYSGHARRSQNHRPKILRINILSFPILYSITLLRWLLAPEGIFSLLAWCN